MSELTAVPLAIGVAVVDSALYDVPGGFRAVMFDRFTGVKPTVRGLGLVHGEVLTDSRQERVPTSLFLDCSALFCTTAGLSLG